MPTRKNQTHRVDQRRKDAIERNESWDNLSPQQQLEKLDERFGKGEGASRQRKRLRKLLKNQ